MLNLKAGNNALHVTLNERITLVRPVILLRLEHTQSSSDVKIIKVLDSSLPTDKANIIALELVANQASEDLDNGKVFLRIGDYLYQIYESPDSILDITGKTRLEQGLAKFDEPTNVDNIYDDTPDEKIYVE